jgi:hypothetical protein
MQRQAAENSPVSLDSRPEVVPTEIGPLPADLWQILGQPVPGPAPVVPRSAEPNRAAAAAPDLPRFMEPGDQTPDKAGEGRTVPHLSGLSGKINTILPGEGQLPQPAAVSAPPVTIQRSFLPPEETLEQPAQTPATREETPESRPPDQKPAGLDLDALARQVYAALRQRLKIEAERFGH